MPPAYRLWSKSPFKIKQSAYDVMHGSIHSQHHCACNCYRMMQWCSSNYSTTIQLAGCLRTECSAIFATVRLWEMTMHLLVLLRSEVKWSCSTLHKRYDKPYQLKGQDDAQELIPVGNTTCSSVRCPTTVSSGYTATCLSVRLHSNLWPTTTVFFKTTFPP